MMDALKYNQLKLYCGADFDFSFRVLIDGTAVNPADVQFKAVDDDGTIVFDNALGDSPVFITVDDDDNYLITIRQPASLTATVTAPKLNYQVDITLDTGEHDRWMMGEFICVPDVADAP
jgi:hypothetical protein